MKRLGMIAAAGAAAAVAAAIGTGTFAQLSDATTAPEVIATAGTLVLGSDDLTSSTADWKVDDLKPGDEVTRDFEIFNAGNVDGVLTLSLKAVGTKLDLQCNDPEGKDELKARIADGRAKAEADTKLSRCTDDSELPANLNVSVAFGGEPPAPVQLAQIGKSADYQLASFPDKGIKLDGAANMTVSITLSVPADVNNIIQSDQAALTLSANLKQA